MKAIDIEVAIAGHLNYRKNLIVPNVKWGLGFAHELDLFVMTPAGRGWEVEIKVSKADLKRDSEKGHNHRDRLNRISRLYFAVPEKLQEAALEHVPDRAGILVVRKTMNDFLVKRIREAETVSRYKFTEADRQKLLELAYLRTWGLRRKLKATA